MGLKDAILYGMIVGLILATLVTLVTYVVTLYDFRHRVMLCRKGARDFNPADALMLYYAPFVGSFLSGSMFGFLLIVFVCVLVALPFAWPLIWTMLWENAGYLFCLFALPTIINLAVSMIVKKFLFGKNYIYFRPLHSIYLFWQTWLSMLGGVIGALVRLGIGLAGILLFLPLLCGPVSPQFLNQFKVLDSGHKSYLAQVESYHHHNNPIVLMASKRLLAIVAARKACEAKGRKWPRARFLLLLMLARFPSLKQWRKHALAKAKELKQLQDKQRKQKLALEDAQKAPEVATREDATREDAWVGLEAERLEASLKQMEMKVELFKRSRLQLQLAGESSLSRDTILSDLRRQLQS